MKKLVTLPEQKWQELRKEGFHIPRDPFKVINYFRQETIQEKLLPHMNFSVAIKVLNNQSKVKLMSMLMEDLFDISTYEACKIETVLEENNNTAGSKIFDELCQYYDKKQKGEIKHRTKIEEVEQI